MMKLALAALLIGLAACGGGRNNNVIVVDGPEIDALELCDPRAQTGCEATQKCATRFLQTMPTELSEIACVPDGTVDIDGACMYGPAGAAGYSNCKKGGECVGGVCKQICDHQGGNPRCDTNHACSRYENIFESNNMTVAGVCDTKCDPLTQALAIGMTTAACGSANAAMADSGCFTFDLIDFTCARIPLQARNLTDRMRGFGPASGGVYINGCAAGYMPMLIEATGSMVGICSGLCAPGKSSMGNTNLAKGDPAVVAKLHNVATPAAGDGVCTVGKKGSEADMNCHFMWWYNTNMQGQIIPSAYNDTTGICFGYGHYMINHDNNPATPLVGFPRCENLPAAGMPADMTYGNANNWPCVPAAEAMFDGAKQVNPVARDFRVGATPGRGVRHTLRQ